MTRLLLDTHLVLWWLNDDPRLPEPVVEQPKPVQAVEPEPELVEEEGTRVMTGARGVNPRAKDVISGQGRGDVHVNGRGRR